MTVPAVIGREADQAGIEQFLEALPAGSAALVVAGEAGIGKTTLWQAAVESAGRRGFRVLVARPGESEARLSYSGLGDLLDGVAEEIFDELPEPQRRALDVALLRAGNDGNPPDQRSVSVALLAVLRLIAADAPVVVAIDDVQWLDHSSARVLHFALRRLGPSPVGLVVALRVEPGLVDPLDVAHGVVGGRLWRIDVGPLSLDAVDHMVHAQLGAGLARPTMVRVHRASGGNPFFALELARALRGRDAELVPGQPLPIPDDLRALLGARLAALPDDARRAVQVVAALAQPSAALVGAVLGTRSEAGVAGALQAAMLRADGDRLRLVHPLLGSVGCIQSSVEQRRDLHESIAAATRDPEERARHLALAATGPDAAVADALDEASRAATSRGATDAAAELCELSRRLTPVGDKEKARRRAVRAARHNFAAGDWPLAATQLEEIIAATPPGPARADALRLLGELRYHHDVAEAVRLLKRALAEAGDDERLRAAIELDIGAVIITTSANTEASRIYAESAVTHAEHAGDAGLLAMALAVAGMVDFLAGRAGVDDKMTRAVALEDPERPNVLFGRPSFVAGMVWMWTERHNQAHEALERLYRHSVDRGEENALPLVAMFAAWLACSLGALDDAAGYARTSFEASTHVGGDVSVGVGLLAQAIVAAHTGDINGARRQAHEATGLFTRSGWMMPSIWSAWILGFVELSVGDPAAAHGVLGPVSALIIASGTAEPGPAPSIPDDIEAMVALGELEQAEELLTWLEERGRRFDRAWALAAAGRCRALLLASRGNLEAAAAAIEAAIAQHDRIPLPFERGRTLLVKGQLERRRKHKAAAKQALEESLTIFETVGTSLWAQRARSELSRVNIRPPAPFELTPTEAKVAELAASGLSTKQVAERAFLSPRSVEGVLARIYSKLDISSRAELANTMAARRSFSPPSPGVVRRGPAAK